MAELAAALEIGSEHPLADAIVKFAAETLGHSLEPLGAQNASPIKHGESAGARKVDWVMPAKDLTIIAGKGIVGWAASSGSWATLGSGLSAAAGPETPTKRSSAKPSPAKGPSLAKNPSPAKGGHASNRELKVVLGNKQMMADENVPISKAVDEYMRDMEVRVFHNHGLESGIEQCSECRCACDHRHLKGLFPRQLVHMPQSGHLSERQGAAVGRCGFTV